MMSIARRSATISKVAQKPFAATARRAQATTVAPASTDVLTALQRADAAALAGAGRMDAATWVRTFQAPGAAVHFQAPPTTYPTPDFQIAHAANQSTLVRALPVAIASFFWLSFHTLGCVYADAALPWLAQM
jgi:hypothetical protein